jgi:hypothetical protein
MSWKNSEVVREVGSDGLWVFKRSQKQQQPSVNSRLFTHKNSYPVHKKSVMVMGALDNGESTKCCPKKYFLYFLAATSLFAFFLIVASVLEIMEFSIVSDSISFMFYRPLLIIWLALFLWLIDLLRIRMKSSCR